MSTFFEKNKYLLFDGGMGSMLQKSGMQAGELPERWNLIHPEKVLAIHKAYVEAGSDVITTNTFGANSKKLPEDITVKQTVTAAISIARQSGARFVAQDIGPIGALLEPLGTLRFEEAYALFKEQVLAGEEAGADLYIIETMTDLYETKAALLAVKENSSKPVVTSMSYQGDGRTFLGTSPEVATYTLCNLGADAVGVNCSLGPKELYPIVEQICDISTKPVIVQANAGLPEIVDGKTVYNIGPEEYASDIEKMLPLGVSILGGCCGTTPDYIRELKRITQGKAPIIRKNRQLTAVTSARKLVSPDRTICVVGERINPTGKPLLKKALKEGNFQYIIEEAISQEESGADLLGCNCGLPGIDETAALVRAVKEVQAVTSLPIQIDSSEAEALEAAVRIYNGIPTINSVNGKQETMSKIFPIAAKYGAVVICLTLDEDGIPVKAEDRIRIAEKIIAKASEYGIPRERLVFDCLTMTAATEQKSAMETIRAVRMVREDLGLHTMLGVSNISFGLPDREVVNAGFLAAAVANGLDMPIINSKSRTYMDVIDSYRIFNMEDENSFSFIEKHTGRSEGKADDDESELSTAERMTKVILSGRKGDARPLAEELLQSMPVLEIINGILIPALDEVSVRFEKGKMFLPQLMASAETVKAAFDLLKEKSEAVLSTGKKIIVATVKGDIHDIGKNIVKMLLENYGFEVIDLGRDVEPQAIVDCIRKTDAKLVGLSALMTTTAKYMAETVSLIRSEGLDTKVVVGGAVITADYAKEIDADYYAKDAAQTAQIASEVLG